MFEIINVLEFNNDNKIELLSFELNFALREVANVAADGRFVGFFLL